MNVQDKIPKGEYCYTIESVDEDGKMIIKTCPFWSRRLDKPEQENGYCGFLGIGDWNEDISHLWDMVKECDINTAEK